ncbi:MAG: FAD-dependent oxidoreductase [Acidimicrobiia bacterium]
MAKRMVIIGAGPGGSEAATLAARLGAEVILIERDIVGGAANLWDCIPSKAMIASGGALRSMRQSYQMGLGEAQVSLDHQALADRVSRIESQLHASLRELLVSQGVQIVNGFGRMVDAHTVVAETDYGERRFEADIVVLATGSNPRVPSWAPIDGRRVLTTRDAYPPPEFPSHLVVVGSGVTGVEFVNMFTSFGSKVSLVVSRQQVLPQKDPEVAAVLETDFLERGVRLLKGARAERIEVSQSGEAVTVFCDDGRSATGSHALLAIGSVPNSAGLGLEEAGVEVDEGGYVVVNHNMQSSQPHIYVAGDLSGKLPLASVASMQGRKIAEHALGLHQRPHRHIDYNKAASAIFTDPEIADVGLAEADAFAEGRKIQVIKVPFSSSAKALINDDSRGFVKLISDPATGVVLGGSIVGAHAAELISVIALAVNARLTVTDIAESVLVHPSLAEALTYAAR